MTTTDTMKQLLNLIMEVWRLNRDKPLAVVLDDIKTLSDNPSRHLYDSDDTDLTVGANRYLSQEKRDHPDRLAQADAEDAAEEERKAAIKPFKDMSPEEQLAYKRELIAKARDIRKKNLASRRDGGA